MGGGMGVAWDKMGWDGMGWDGLSHDGNARQGRSEYDGRLWLSSLAPGWRMSAVFTHKPDQTNVRQVRLSIYYDGGYDGMVSVGSGRRERSFTSADTYVVEWEQDGPDNMRHARHFHCHPADEYSAASGFESMSKARAAAEEFVTEELHADLASATSPRLQRHEAALVEKERMRPAWDAFHTELDQAQEVADCPQCLSEMESIFCAWCGDPVCSCCNAELGGYVGEFYDEYEGQEYICPECWSTRHDPTARASAEAKRAAGQASFAARLERARVAFRHVRDVRQARVHAMLSGAGMDADKRKRRM